MTGAARDRGVDVDVALVGGGGAAVALLHQLALRGPAGLRVAVVDPVDRLAGTPADRTWCFWDAPGDATRGDLGAPGQPGGAVHRQWESVRVVGPGGGRLDLDLAPMRYAMVRSQDYYARVAAAVAAAGLDVVHVPATADRVDDAPDAAIVGTLAGDVRTRWVFDSRPAPPLRPARTALLQHFRGQVVRTDRPAFDPGVPVLMDFTTGQPADGLSFGYCLPSDERTALLEYTEFSPAVLDDAGYTAALGAYLRRVTGGADVEVLHTEQGAIPMSDAVPQRRPGVRVVRIGTAGGATRASTGYTFTAMQRQARWLAGTLARHGPGADPAGPGAPVPPSAYPRRHSWMDALVLRALADGTLAGPAFFTDLFVRNPAARVLRFLDGATTRAEEVALMATAPRVPMLRAALLDAAHRRPIA